MHANCSEITHKNGGQNRHKRYTTCKSGSRYTLLHSIVLHYSIIIVTLFE
jgi:hypothetical protein